MNIFDAIMYTALCTLALGGFLLANAAIEDTKKALHAINKSAKLERNLEHLAEFIEYHSDLKQLSNHIVKVIQN